MATTSICRAKDPSSCPYHGAVMRMHNAQKTGNYEEYYQARLVVEEKEKTGWTEQDLQEKTGVKPKTKTPTIVRSDSPEAQSGKIFDTIEVINPEYPDEPTKFYRRKDNNFPNEPYQIRVQANRTLKPEDVEKMASLMGYNYRSTIAGEPLGWPQRDTPYSFIVSADTTKSRRDDLGQALGDFETKLPEMLQNGSPILKRGSKGKKAGEQAIQGFHEPALKIELYYDSITEND